MSDEWEPVNVEPAAEPAESFEPASLGISPESDGKAACPECGGRFTVTKAGAIRQHKCGGVQRVKNTSGKPRRAKRAGTPSTVRDLSVALIASSVEYVTAQAVGRSIPCDPALVPADLPDADAMIGPLIELAWPQLPKRAQKVVTRIADESDLIAAALGWFEYQRTLSKWAAEQRALTAPAIPGESAPLASVHFPAFTPDERITPDEPTSGTVAGYADASGAEPFAPA